MSRLRLQMLSDRAERRHDVGSGIGPSQEPDGGNHSGGESTVAEAFEAYGWWEKYEVDLLRIFVWCGSFLVLLITE